MKPKVPSRETQPDTDYKEKMACREDSLKTKKKTILKFNGNKYHCSNLHSVNWDILSPPKKTHSSTIDPRFNPKVN